MLFRSPQALALMNNHFVHGRSEALAQRVSEKSSHPNEALRIAWRTVLAREPKQAELSGTRAHYEAQLVHFQGVREAAERTPAFLALASVCHVLLNSNEFLYVD